MSPRMKHPSQILKLEFETIITRGNYIMYKYVFPFKKHTKLEMKQR